MPSNSFVNPYTFIGLGNNSSRRFISDGQQYGKLTGVLHCTLEPLTPLFIPNTTSEHAFPEKELLHIKVWNQSNTKNQFNDDDLDDAKENDKSLEDRTSVRSYDFYSYDDLKGGQAAVDPNKVPRPIIPGASIRGAIRSAYETLTDSCMSTTDVEMTLHRRSPMAYDRDRRSNNMGVGIVDNGILMKGKKALIPTDAEWHSEAGFKQLPRNSLHPWSKIKVAFSGKFGHYDDNVVSHVYLPTDANVPNNTFEAYFIPGEQFGTSKKKHFDTIIYDIQTDSKIILSDDDILLYEILAKQLNGYKDWVNAKPMPVYYEKVGSNYYISPACISQEVFARSLKTILGEYAPCNNSKNLCEACSLFGMVETDTRDKNSDANHAVASRVSFRDAVPAIACDDWSNWYNEPSTIAILGGPHITATEFYMENIIGSDIYNYDYKVSHDTFIDRGNSKRVWRQQQKTALEDNEVRIRGRKYYWHNDIIGKVTLDKDKPNQTATVRAIKSSNPDNAILFKFDVAFENITLDELSKLAEVLTIGNKASHAHKLGHGKPIGFGSVRITIKSGEVFEVGDGLNIVSNPLPELTEPDLKHKAEFLRVTDWDNRPKGISYPKGIVDGTESIYNWFVLNREMPDATPNKQAFFSVLPNVLDADQNLPCYTKTRSSNNNKYETHSTLRGNRSQPPSQTAPGWQSQSTFMGYNNTPRTANGSQNNADTQMSKPSKTHPIQPSQRPYTTSNQSPQPYNKRVAQPTTDLINATINNNFNTIMKQNERQPENGLKEKQIKKALTHFRNFCRIKADDGKYLAILKEVPKGNTHYNEAQLNIKKYGNS